MAAVDQEQELRAKIRKHLSSFEEFTPESLAREDLGRGLNFKAGTPCFERVLSLVDALSGLSLSDASVGPLTALEQVLGKVYGIFVKIRDFSIEGNPQNPVAARDALIAAAQGLYDPLFAASAPLIAYGIREGTADIEKLKVQAIEAVEALSLALEQQRVRQAELEKEIKDTLDKVKRAAQEVGVAQHSIHFADEAKRHELSSKNWLTWTIILGAVTIAVAGILLVYTPAILETATTSLHLVVTKTFILVMLLSGTIWAGKTYKSHCHNLVVNRHRQNALSTFETFAKAASDDQTKAAVLTQATQCIFLPQASGYAPGESVESNQAQIIEVVRGLTGSGR